MGQISREEARSYCPQYDTVQKFVDEATNEAKAAGPYLNATVFGTAVHIRLRDKIRRLDNPFLIAEHSLVSEAEGMSEDRNIVRVDVYEDYQDKSDICIYDLKTGRRGLSTARTLEFARRARSLDRNKIVIEVRPFE